MKCVNTKKIEKLKLNKENIYIVLDFDRTITSFDSEDSWDACGEMLSEEFKKKLIKYYAYYGAIEVDYQIDRKQKEEYMLEWYKKCMELYYEYNLTKQNLEEAIAKSKLIFRKGVKEFLKYTSQNNIPVIILSAGIGNVIKGFLKNNNCLFDNIYIVSNFIEFDEKGNMKRFEGELIHSLNKTVKNHLPEDIQNTIKNKDYGVLVGDLIDDKKMAEGEESNNILTIGLLGKEDNLQIYNQNFDIVLTREDAKFQEIEEIIF